MQQQISLQDLKQFIGKAALATYAGGGKETTPERRGFRELEYTKGDWHYRDSFTGYLRSWGQEVVRFQGEPCWTALYGGGMTLKYQEDIAFAHETFEFLKKALSASEKQVRFQPRGPKDFRDGNWKYECKWSGDITRFIGEEEIFYIDHLVFTHDFMGGLIISR